MTAIIGWGCCGDDGRGQMHQVHHRGRTTCCRDRHHRLDEVPRPTTQAAHGLGEQQTEETGVGESSNLFGGECSIPVNFGCGAADELHHVADSIDHVLVSHGQLPGRGRPENLRARSSGLATERAISVSS